MNNFINNENAGTRYELSNYEKATPYYQRYYAAWLKKPYKAPVFEPKYMYPKPKRTPFVVLILILMVAVIAVAAISFLGLVPQLTFFNKVNDIDIAEDNQPVGVADIIYSTVKKTIGMETEDELIFYEDALRDVDNAELTKQIAFYAIPASIILTVLIAVYILIKSISALTSDKRKKFPYISLILLLFSLLGVVGGAVWNGQPMENLTGYLMGGSTNIELGLGYLVIVILEVLALVFSLFAYRSKNAIQNGRKLVGYDKVEK